MAKWFTVEYTDDAEATPREPRYRTVKAASEGDARQEVQIWASLNGDRVNVGKAMTNG